MNKQKNVLITGSSGTIGFVIAKKFKEQQYNVLLTGRDQEKLEKNGELLNSKFFVCDLQKSQQCSKMIEKIFNCVGVIDILINNAGDYEYVDFEKSQRLETILDVNLKASLLLAKYVIPKMKEKKCGRIINIGSISGVMGESFAVGYSASKSGLIGFSKALALEVAQYGITVNTINPGWVKTDLGLDSIEKSDFSVEQTIEMVPQKRFIEPEEIADLCLFLSSHKARGITGQSINLCAGLSTGY